MRTNRFCLSRPWGFLFVSLTWVVAALIGTQAGQRQWHEESGYRWADLEVKHDAKTVFTFLPSTQTGITFSNVLSELSIAANRVLANGSGVAVGDFDNDGRPDIYLCGLESRNTLYRNLGNWKFQDVTVEAGVACDGKLCRGAVFADLNGDGSLDLLISTVNDGVLCFFNNGAGKFTERTSASGLRSLFASMTLALADVDGNGSLDLYVANNRPNDMRDRGQVSFSAVNGKPVIPQNEKNHFLYQNGQLLEYGQPDQLFLNDGAGHFQLASWSDGKFLDEAGQKLSEPPLDWGLTATFRDVNGDMAPDLYVCNDYWTPDRFWINDGHGQFRAIDKLAVRKTSASSMGVDFADVDRDGRLDFFVVDMLSRDTRLRKRQMFADRPVASVIGAIEDRPQSMRNTFFRAREDGTYAEIANFAHLIASDWAWSPFFLDVDLDGYEDLIISAGHFRDVQDLDASNQIKALQHSWKGFKNDAERQKAYTQELMEHYRLYPHLDMPMVAFRNSGDWKFDEKTGAWGLNQLGVHHGMALGDFDQDGDLDFVVNNLNGTAGVYRNDSSAGRVAVRLKGKSPNTQGIGSKVSLLDGAIPVQTTEMVSGGHYLSGSEALLVFAAGKNAEGMTLEVKWRAGTVSAVKNVHADKIYEIAEPVAETKSGNLGKSSELQPKTNSSSNTTRHEEVSRFSNQDARPIFKDVSSSISHTHPQPDFNDFARQPLLPFKPSQSGPGIAWFDLNGDGHDDLIIGSGKEVAPVVFLGDGRGGFSRISPSQVLANPNHTAGLVGWTDENGKSFLIAGNSGYEMRSTNAAVRLRINGAQLESAGTIATDMANGGALAMADLDGSGHLVLFIAGGVVPGRYPLGAPSKIFRYDGQQWQLDARNSVLLENLGIVNAAVWSDLDNDGIPELILACEWGPIRVFQKRGAVLFEATQDFGLSKFTGLWRGVTTGDLDGDGRQDIIAANWGLNSPYQASDSQPLVLYYGELSQPGILDIIETEYDSISGKLAPRRPLFSLASSMPFLFERFANHKAFSESTIEEFLGERKILVRRTEVTTLASVVFMNRGNRFEPIALPREAQLAPAFSVNVGDFDGDGNEDVFVSQNLFSTQAELPRMDGGRGLLLRGDGTGRLEAISGSKSGVKVYGEQRGAAVGDFNEDGRADLVVSQNGTETKLFENVGAMPGLRTILKGPPGNPHGVGAVLRAGFGERYGPAREIHAGSGYWSQDSFTQVFGTPVQATSIWIRWPGGRVTTTTVPENAKEITIDSGGKLVSSK